MDTGPLRSPTEIGRRVVVRGRRWTVEGLTRSVDCTAIRLRQASDGREQTLLTPFDRPQPIDSDPRPRAVRPRRWLHDLDRALLQLHPFGGLRAAAQMPIRLLPYQLEPALAVLHDGVSRMLIADGVGLGKTIQAGLLLLELSHRHATCRALVITPAGLREQWRDELRARFGLAPILADTVWLRSQSDERPAHVNPWSLPGIHVVSHDLVKRPEVLRPLEDVTWDAVVVDEAHAVTSGTDRRAAIDAIALRSRHVVLLTATPHGGDPAEFAALCRIGRGPDDHDPIVVFRRSRTNVGDGRPRKTTVLTVTPSDAERRMHDLLHRYSRRVWQEAAIRGDDRARLVAIVLRKRALSSAASLCVSVERRLALLSAPQPDEPWQLNLPLAPASDEDPLEDDVAPAMLAAPGLADPRRERRWLGAIADAARLATHDERKMAFLLRLLARLRRSRAGVETHASEPAIVFTEYRDTLARLQHRIAAAGHDGVVVLHGGLSPAERTLAQQDFNRQGGILLATDAASEGLNLHHRCRVVIHYELPWNPSRLEQRAGRVDRLGQTRRVHELALVAAHTAERLVIAPLFARLAGARSARGVMLDALTESRVAAAVMTNSRPASVSIGETATGASCAVSVPPEPGARATSEAARLEHHRTLAARSCRNRAAAVEYRPSVSALGGRAYRRAGLFLVFALAISSADGSRLHAEPLLVRIDLHQHVFAARRRRPTTRRLQEVLAALVRLQDSTVSSLVHDSARQRLADIAPLEETRRDRYRRRERAMNDAIAPGPSAARLLVQQGLFDRRSLRAAALRAATVAARQDEMHERTAALADDVPPAAGAELLAALLVYNGR